MARAVQASSSNACPFVLDDIWCRCTSELRTPRVGSKRFCEAYLADTEAMHGDIDEVAARKPIKDILNLLGHGGLFGCRVIGQKTWP